jgi:hypothetical protein
MLWPHLAPGDSPRNRNLDVPWSASSFGLACPFVQQPNE